MARKACWPANCKICINSAHTLTQTQKEKADRGKETQFDTKSAGITLDTTSIIFTV